MSNEMSRPLITYVTSLGAEDAHVVPTKGHPRLVFTWQGREVRYIFSGSCSDVRALENAKTEIRAKLGVRREIVKSARPARIEQPRPKRTTLPPCPEITPLPDWRDQLRNLVLTGPPAPE